MKYGYRTPSKHSSSISDKFHEEQIQINVNNWILEPAQNNPVYGRKISLKPFSEQDDKKGERLYGLIETDLRTYSKNENREICTTFIEFNDDKFASGDRLSVPESWADSITSCREIQQKFLHSHFSTNQGIRTARTYGIITDSGEFDQDLIILFDECIAQLRQNLRDLSNGKSVVNGKGNFVKIISEICRVFAYSNWNPSYEFQFKRIRQEFESILESIEQEELTQLGHRLPGTERDFKLVRAMMKGILSRQSEVKMEEGKKLQKLIELLNHESESPQQIKSKLYDINLLRFSQSELEPLIESIKICHYLNERDKHNLIHEINKSNKFSIRVIGMSQSTFPYSIDAYWMESIGSLATDKHNCRIGSVVRFDLKSIYRKGTPTPRLSNICYASDELDLDCKLKSCFKLSNDSNWPETLPNTTWLPIDTPPESIREIDDLPMRNIPMFIKYEKKYATHPSLEVEIPIFDQKSLPDDISPAQLRLCTIDVRRDLRKGSFDSRD